MLGVIHPAGLCVAFTAATGAAQLTKRHTQRAFGVHRAETNSQQTGHRVITGKHRGADQTQTLTRLSHTGGRIGQIYPIAVRADVADGVLATVIAATNRLGVTLKATLGTNTKTLCVVRTAQQPRPLCK